MVITSVITTECKYSSFGFIHSFYLMMLIYSHSYVSSSDCLFPMVCVLCNWFNGLYNSYSFVYLLHCSVINLSLQEYCGFLSLVWYFFLIKKKFLLKIGSLYDCLLLQFNWAFLLIWDNWLYSKWDNLHYLQFLHMLINV